MTFFLVLLLYSWGIYPAIVLTVRFFIKDKSEMPPLESGPNTPFVSIVIPVFNGEDMIEAKIENCFSQQYEGLFEVIIVSDCSNDKTRERVLAFKDKTVNFIELDSRVGKSAAQNQGVLVAKGDFILFTDVDSILISDALQTMVSALKRDEQVGCVGARVAFEGANIFQRFYWFIETKVRLAESQLGILSSVSGAAMLIERKNFRTLDLDTGDDMVIPLDLKLHSKLNTVYTDDALVKDCLAKGNRNILNSRRRITRRNLLAVSRRSTLLNPFEFGFVSVSVFSRKILRWLTPFFLLAGVTAYLFLYDVVVVVYVALFATTLLLFIKDKALSAVMEVLGLFLGVYDFVRGHKTKSY